MYAFIVGITHLVGTMVTEPLLYGDNTCTRLSGRGGKYEDVQPFGTCNAM